MPPGSRLISKWSIHGSSWGAIYTNGNLATRFKVWIGGPTGPDSIAYTEGRSFDYGHDNSCNDWLSINDAGSELRLDTSGIGLIGDARSKLNELPPEEAAEYLWLRVIAHIR